MADDNERGQVAEIEILARRSDLRFFHWENEFPEVFFGFADTNQRHLKHKNEIEKGAAGFDAVVGNPPYVRTERLPSAEKTYFKRCFPYAYDGKADIYGRERQYRYLLNFEPAAMAGYSIYIYHITPEDAESVRRELGLSCPAI